MLPQPPIPGVEHRPAAIDFSQRRLAEHGHDIRQNRGPMQTIITFIRQDRNRAGNLARAAIFSGGWLLIAGAVGAVLMNAFSAPIVLAGKIAPTSLGEMFPDVPLFWVPEGPPGYVA